MSAKRLSSLGIAIGLTFGVIAVFLGVTGYSPWVVLTILIRSTWASPSGILSVAVKAALLILSGLAVVIPYRAGLFNIGGEGQILAGGVAAALIGIAPLQFLGPLHVAGTLLLGMGCGALWGWAAGWLKTHRGVHEVISTIMLNFIAFQFANELILGPLNAGASASRTPLIQSSAYLPVLVRLGAAELSAGIMVSILMAGFLSWMMYRTWFGFALRAVGENPMACAYSGMRVSRIQEWSMLMGGGCAGLSGAIQVCGIDHTMYVRFAGGYGFDGIAVAFLALCEPWATIPAALVIATLRAADRSLQLDAGVPREMVLMLEGILIIAIAIVTTRRTVK